MSRFLSAVPALPVADERAAVTFYAETLGFTELLDPEGVGLGILVRDHVELHLWVADGSAPGAELELAGSASCRLLVEDVRELYRHCEPHGVVHPRAPLRRTEWGTDEFGLVDPDGNLITLYEQAAAGT
jgi:catechol 2,3-dioxygenase-like lactoylglutathione lyase family enzyme